MKEDSLENLHNISHKVVKFIQDTTVTLRPIETAHRKFLQWEDGSKKRKSTYRRVRTTSIVSTPAPI